MAMGDWPGCGVMTTSDMTVGVWLKVHRAKRNSQNINYNSDHYDYYYYDNYYGYNYN